MKKILFLIMTISLFATCSNDKNVKDRDKIPVNDDYRSGTKDNTELNKDDSKVDDNNDRESKTNGWDKTGSWASADETRFMTDCEGTAIKNVEAARAREYCDCMLQKLKKKYSSYVEADRDLGGSSRTELDRLADECNGQ